MVENSFASNDDQPLKMWFTDDIDEISKIQRTNIRLEWEMATTVAFSFIICIIKHAQIFKNEEILDKFNILTFQTWNTFDHNQNE